MCDSRQKATVRAEREFSEALRRYEGVQQGLCGYTGRNTGGEFERGEPCPVWDLSRIHKKPCLAPSLSRRRRWKRPENCGRKRTRGCALLPLPNAQAAAEYESLFGVYREGWQASGKRRVRGGAYAGGAERFPKKIARESEWPVRIIWGAANSGPEGRKKCREELLAVRATGKSRGGEKQMGGRTK